MEPQECYASQYWLVALPFYIDGLNPHDNGGFYAALYDLSLLKPFP